jgi:hypothetical protein
MKLFHVTILLSALVLLGPLTVQAQDKYADDVNDIQSILTALYEVISGPANEARDWERFIYLFAADGKLIPTTKSGETVGYVYWSPQDYVDLFTSRRGTTDFYEFEINRVVEQYGAIAHVWSTYELRQSPNGEATNRGINSIQLLKTPERWYIMNVFWSSENEGYALPEDYVIRRDGRR